MSKPKPTRRPRPNVVIMGVPQPKDVLEVRIVDERERPDDTERETEEREEEKAA